MSQRKHSQTEQDFCCRYSVNLHSTYPCSDTCQSPFYPPLLRQLGNWGGPVILVINKYLGIHCPSLFCCPPENIKIWGTHSYCVHNIYLRQNQEPGEGQAAPLSPTLPMLKEAAPRL